MSQECTNTGMEEKVLLRKILSVLNIFGIDPLRKNNMATIRALLSIAGYIFLLTECLMKLVYDMSDSNLMTFVDDMITFTAFYQATMKVITAIIYRAQLKDVVSTILHSYWKMNVYGERLELELKNIYRVARKVMILAIGLYIFTGLAFCLRPLILSRRELPIQTYHGSDKDDSIQLFVIAYALQDVVILILGVPIYLFFDFLFAFIIIHVIIELKLIKEGLTKLAREESNESDCMEIKRLVEHHGLVLWCASQAKEIYSLVLLNQFLTTEFMIGICMLNIISDGFPPNFEQTMKTAPLICTYLGSLFIYCILGTFLIDENESVADAAYECCWWKKNKTQLRKSLALMIQRSQRIVKMSAGTLFDLDLESFTKIMNVLLNFFTFAQALLANTKSHT